MSIRERLVAACAYFLLSFSAYAGQEIPIDALLGNQQAFSEWRASFESWYRARLDAIAGFSPTGHRTLRKEAFEGLTLTTVAFDYAPGTPLSGKRGGGILIIPDKAADTLPLIVAIHGHEASSWGSYATELVKSRGWPFEMAKRGFRVWVPVSMYHQEIMSLAKTYSYPLVWTKIISDGLSYAEKQHLWKMSNPAYAATGLSSGGMIAYFLMAYRSDIEIGVFAGADQDLDFLRREYRIKGHPDCWEVEEINSYTTVQALIAPRAAQFQMGRKDAFFPSGKPLPAGGPSFAGTRRGPLSTETGGNALAVRSIYELFGKRDNFAYLIHDGGHEMRAKDALRFIEDHLGQSKAEVEH